MSARTHRLLLAAAIPALLPGAILSRTIESGVRVEKIMLIANTPALQLSPATPGRILRWLALRTNEYNAQIPALRCPW